MLEPDHRRSTALRRFPSSHFASALAAPSFKTGKRRDLLFCNSQLLYLLHLPVSSCHRSGLPCHSLTTYRKTGAEAPQQHIYMYILCVYILYICPRMHSNSGPSDDGRTVAAWCKASLHRLLCEVATHCIARPSADSSGCGLAAGPHDIAPDYGRT